MAIYFPNSEMSEVCGEAWRITSSFTGDTGIMGESGTASWEKSDDVYGGGNISPSVLSESNGIFTFNADYYGYYLIHHQHHCYMSNATSRWNEMRLYVSWNSGANWDYHSYAVTNINNSSSSAMSACGGASSIIAATPATRLRFNIQVENNSVTTYGSTNEQMTGFSIAKVSDV